MNSSAQAALGGGADALLRRSRPRRTRCSPATVVSKRIVSCVTRPIWRRSEVELRVPQVDAVERDPAGRRVVEPREQADERRLPGPGRPDEGDGLAAPDRQVHAREHRLPAIRERDALVGDRAGERARATRAPGFSRISFSASTTSKMRSAEARAIWRTMLVRVTSFSGLYIIRIAARKEMQAADRHPPVPDLARPRR